jgi:uncharacterized protein (DUF1015 family)
MAKIIPFRAWRYDPAKVRIENVVTQPYDKISPEMQDRYYAADPHNLVRVILGRSEPTDGEDNNVYSRAANHFRAWCEAGVLRRDAEPSVYAYQQHFKVPGDPSGIRHRRSGFIALGKIHDYSDEVVFRHEQTLSKPKADRFNLLRATRAHFGQIFMLYRGTHDPLASLTPHPTTQVVDEYGVEHKLWQINDSRVICQVQHELADKQLIIADGHHRYETALTYRNEMRQQYPAAGPEAPWEYVMMTLVNMDAPGLVILPTHRVVKGLEKSQLLDLIPHASEYFTVEDVTDLFDPEQPSNLLGDDAPHFTYRPTMLAITATRAYRLRSKPELEAALVDVPAKARGLDVVHLHKLLLEKALGMSEEDIRTQRYLSYIRNPQQAVASVRSGADQVAFLLNPVRIEQMRDISLAGGVMPQKSTDFYPKLLSGLTIYALD